MELFSIRIQRTFQLVSTHTQQKIDHVISDCHSRQLVDGLVIEYKPHDKVEYIGDGR